MYEEFKKAPNYQALQDNQINKIIAAQQRRYNPSLLGDVYQEKPSNLYQQYLNETGLMKEETYSKRQQNQDSKKKEEFLPPKNYEDAFDPRDIRNQALPEMQKQDFYAGKPNPEPPRSVYSKHVDNSAPSPFGKPTHNFAEKLDYKLTSNNDDYTYVDTYEMDKKRAHQNYSNLLGRKLGDPKTRPEDKMPEYKTDIMGLPQKEGTMEQQRLNQGARSRRDRNNRLFPSLHYTEFKDNRPQRIAPNPLKENPQDMQSRTDRMIQALRQNQDREPEE